MNRINELVTELKKRGIYGQATAEQALDALNSLHSTVTVPVKDGFDDRNDRGMELLMINIQHPQLLNLKAAKSKNRLFRPGLNNRKIKSPTSFLKALEEQEPVSISKEYFSKLVPSHQVPIADLIKPTGPVLRIRVQAIICRNDDGKLTNGAPAQNMDEMTPAIARIIDETNQLFSQAGIQFVFYPSSDVELRNDTRLNQDFQLNASQQSQLYGGKISDENYGRLANVEGPQSTFAYRNEFASKFTNKLVLLFAEGTALIPAPTQPDWRRCKKCESLFYAPGHTVSNCPSGGRHSADPTLNFTPYAFPTDAFSVDPTSSDLQKGWRWCEKCQSMFFSGGIGKCPSGGQHDGKNSGYYVLDPISSLIETFAQVGSNKTQAGWRWCKKCQMLFWGPSQATSNCPDGGTHSLDGSGDYVLSTDQSSPRLIVSAPAGFGFSGALHGFVKLTAEIPLDQAGFESYATFVSHEIGHYLSLWHTHAFSPALPKKMADDPVSAKVAYFKEEIRKHLESELALNRVSYTNILDALDGDKESGISDTAPDVGEELFRYLNLETDATSDECKAVGGCTIHLSDGNAVTFTPDRSLVMSYFKHCVNFDHTFSADQIKKMRNYLIEDHRRPLVGTQLGDTATPSERVCGVWSPNSNGQVYISGWSFADYNKKYQEMNNAGFRLASQQAYLRNGTVFYDAIFNPGTGPQYAVWGKEVIDFKNEDAKLNKAGWNLVHLNSVLLPNNKLLINAIWHQNKWATIWIQGYAQNDLEKKLTEWKHKGYRPIQITGWNLPNKEIRYDAIARPLNLDQPYFIGRTEADFQKLYDDMWQKKFKLLSLDCTRSGVGTLLFSGIFIPDEKPQYITWNASREQIRENYDEMWALGMKLRALNMTAL